MNGLIVNIKELEGRSLCLNGTARDGSPVSVHVGNMLKQYAESLADPAARAAACELYRAAQKEPEKLKELCALRVEQVNNYILCSTNFMRLFFTTVSLGDADRPVVQNETMQEVAIGYVGQHGTPRMQKAIRPHAETYIDLKYLTSPRVMYYLRDIYAGNIGPAAMATYNIAFDLANQMDKECYTLMTALVASGGAFGTFTFTGAKVSRIYVPNSRIVTANLPSTNDITLTGNSGSTKFRFLALKEAGNYGAKWAGCFPDGELVPTGEIVVPSGDCSDLADEITPTTQAIQSRVSDEILVQGPVSVGYLGRRWTLIPDNTIASGSAYVRYNKPLGTVYLKPSQDDEFVETKREQNQEWRSQQKVFGAAILNQHRMRAARITYHS